MNTAATPPASPAPPPGWMLLHLPSLPADPAALFDRLGLSTDAGDRLRMGATPLVWATGDAALEGVGRLAGADPRTLGLAAPPSLAPDRLLALALAPDVPREPAHVLRLCTAAGLLATALDADAIGWSPAGLWSSAALFADAVVATERQGLPPIMHLVAFTAADGTVASDGLGWLCGQELRLTAPSRCSDRDALRRAARLAVDAFLGGGLRGGMTIAGIGPGERLDIGRPLPADGGAAPVVQVTLHLPPG